MDNETAEVWRENGVRRDIEDRTPFVACPECLEDHKLSSDVAEHLMDAHKWSYDEAFMWLRDQGG